MVRRTATIVAMSVAGVALVSCTWLIGLPDVPDAGETGEGGACSAPSIPAAPSPNTSSSDAIGFTAAISKWELGKSDAGPYYGFNLDGTCTCPGADSCQRADAACDNPNGVDDSVRRVFEHINTVAPDGGLVTEAAFNTALASGAAGVLIDVRNYNGLADDSAVTVTVYASRGLANSAAPKLDGTDVWTLNPASGAGAFTTNSAYVANNVLVAKLDTLHIIVGTSGDGPITIDLESALILASIKMSGTAFVGLEAGLIGGRLDPAKFLTGLQSVPDSLFGGHLCGDADITYRIIKTDLCASLDLTLDPSKVGGSCDAVSFGLGFEAVPAVKGAVTPGPDAGSPCGASWTDHC